MEFNLKQIIYNELYDSFDVREDINKIEGRGLNQRYNEMLAEDLDVNVVSLVNNLIDNTIIPSTAQEKFIPYLESLLGLTKLVDSIAVRRKLLSNILSIYKVKGTLQSYEILFKSLGFSDIALERLSKSFGFDSAVTFDDEFRRLDLGKCFNCINYDIRLEGNVQLTEDLIDTIRRAVPLVEPIYAKLNKIYYNNQDIDTFVIFIDDNGDLKYSASSPNIMLDLDENGDLLISGSESNKYELAPNGDYIDKYGN